MRQVIDMILVEFAHLQSDIADFPSHIGELTSHDGDFTSHDGDFTAFIVEMTSTNRLSILDEPFIHSFLEAFYLLIVLCCSVEIHRYLTDKRHEHDKHKNCM